MYQLAQLNIAHLKQALDHPDTRDFVDNLDLINGLAESSPGFIWRLKGEASGNATDVVAFDDPLVIVNLSVWESPELLKAFTYKSQHADFVRRRKEWFHAMADAYYVLWWVPVGYLPTVEEAKARLEHLREHGETDWAFSFRRVSPAPA